MSSLSDILTTAKNIVTAINGLGQTYLSVQGKRVSPTMSTTTLITTGQGRLASISVLTVVAGGGAADGVIYDSNSISNLTNPIARIVGTSTITVVNLPFNNGLVFYPGTAMSAVVSYSGE